MACNQIEVNVPPDRVFDVLMDAWAYPKWVVGAHDIRSVEEGWPAPGSGFHHRVGVPPLLVNDNTKMVAQTRPSEVVLDARARPFGEAVVRVKLQPTPKGSQIVIEESLKSAGPFGIVSRLADPFIHVRNVRSLGRLRNVVEDDPSAG